MQDFLNVDTHMYSNHLFTFFKKRTKNPFLRLLIWNCLFHHHSSLFQVLFE